MQTPSQLGNDAFLDAFSAFETTLRDLLGEREETPYSVLLQRAARHYSKLRPLFDDLRAIGDIRNLLSHGREPVMRLVDANATALEVLRRSRELLQTLPARALDVGVGASTIYRTTLAACAHQVMTTMREKVFTHVPVMDGDRLAGVFSESVVFAMVADQVLLVDEKTLIGDFEPFLNLEAHPGEVFRWLPRGASFAEARELFENTVTKHERLAAVFVTEHGKPDEALLGMLTAWDVAGV